MHNRQSARLSYKSGCVTLTWCIIMLRFDSSSLNVWLIFQTKNNARNAPHLPKSCTEAMTRVLQIVTHTVREKRNGVQRRTKVSFGRTMMQSTGATAVGEKAHLQTKRR